MKIVKIIPVLTLLVFNAVILTGCAVEKTLPTSQPGSIAVRIVPTSAVHIVQASARQEGAILVVDGKIQRRWIGNRGIVKGHIDIDVLDANGTPIRSLRTSCSPAIIPNLSNVRSSFKARVPVAAPEGGVVKVRFHNGPDENREVL